MICICLFYDMQSLGREVHSTLAYLCLSLRGEAITLSLSSSGLVGVISFLSWLLASIPAPSRSYTSFIECGRGGNIPAGNCTS